MGDFPNNGPRASRKSNGNGNGAQGELAGIVPGSGAPEGPTKKDGKKSIIPTRQSLFGAADSSKSGQLGRPSQINSGSMGEAHSGTATMRGSVTADKAQWPAGQYAKKSGVLDPSISKKLQEEAKKHAEEDDDSDNSYPKPEGAPAAQPNSNG